MFSKSLSPKFLIDFFDAPIVAARTGSVSSPADGSGPNSVLPQINDSDFIFGQDNSEYTFVPAESGRAEEGWETNADAPFVFYDLDVPTTAEFVPQTGTDVFANVGNDGRQDPDPVPDQTPDPSQAVDVDPDPAPTPLDPPEEPEAPTNPGRPALAQPIDPFDTPESEAPGTDNVISGRPPDAIPDIPPDTGPATTYTSGGPASSAYNVTVDFVGTWSTQLQDAFVDAADYLSTIILADLPDAIVDGVAIDDITITATLEGIDGVGGVLGSAGPRDIRIDGTFLPSTGAMTFDSADAANQDAVGNWDAIVLHEMMHALGFGTLWNAMGLTSGSVAGGDIRFTGINATDVYQTEFPGIAGADAGSLSGVPVETDGGPGTAGGHWDELLFDEEIMTGFIDAGAFLSEMTIAAFEDMGYDTAFDNPYSATDLNAPFPADPLLDVLA